MKFNIITIILALFASYAFAGSNIPLKVMIAPGTLKSNDATIVWDPPTDYQSLKQYHIFLNGREVGQSTRCNYRFTTLNANTEYKCVLKSEGSNGTLSAGTTPIIIKTTKKGREINITDYGAKGDDMTLNTKSIQKAIDACPAGGTVMIPAGTFLSGALYLKSHITLDIAKNAVLKGSANEADYLPFINNRFEGWEMKTYASLINAGVMDHKGGYVVEDLSIRGEGTILGGGTPLAKNMIDETGLRSRGRLFCLMNCRNVELQGLRIENSPCWTIHYIYCKGVSCHDLVIISTAHNGDGLDPDSSDDSYIFNCTFSTGDDCIAIKSGKNPEGYFIGKPTRNVRITDCNFLKGHGISIGSEMSGGVSGVLVRNCKAGPLLHGMQIKGTKDRGGYVKDVTVLDCTLQQITIFSAVNYNNDGLPAPVLPTFENFTFANIDLTGASAREPAIDINGFKDLAHRLKNVSFLKITLPNGAKISVTAAEQITFSEVKTVSGEKPEYNITDSERVKSD